MEGHIFWVGLAHHDLPRTQKVHGEVVLGEFLVSLLGKGSSATPTSHARRVACRLQWHPWELFEAHQVAGEVSDTERGCEARAAVVSKQPAAQTAKQPVSQQPNILRRATGVTG